VDEQGESHESEQEESAMTANEALTPRPFGSCILCRSDPCVPLLLTRCAVAAIVKLPSLLSCVTAMKMRSLNDVTIRLVGTPCTGDHAEAARTARTNVREEKQRRDSS